MKRFRMTAAPLTLLRPAEWRKQSLRDDSRSLSDN